MNRMAPRKIICGGSDCDYTGWSWKTKPHQLH